MDIEMFALLRYLVAAYGIIWTDSLHVQGKRDLQQIPVDVLDGATMRPELDTAPEIMSRTDSPGGRLRFPGFHSSLNVFSLPYETKL